MDAARYSNYYGEHASTYDQFRFDGDAEVTATIAWLLARVAINSEPRVIEVGAGTARYLAALRQRLVGARCMALDRSIAQLQQVQDPAVGRLCVTAERLPLDQTTIDLVMVVMAIHQFGSLARGAFFGEVARVLIPRSGLIFIKTSSHQDLASRPLVQYFPESVLINQGRYPDIDILTDELKQRGLTVVAVESLATRENTPVERLISMVRRRGNTTLDLLQDSSFRKGLEALENDLRECEVFEFVHQHTYIVASAS